MRGKGKQKSEKVIVNFFKKQKGLQKT